MVPPQTSITPVAWLQLSSGPCQRRAHSAGQRRTLETFTAIESSDEDHTNARFTYIPTGYNMCYATGEWNNAWLSQTSIVSRGGRVCCEVEAV